MQSAKLDPSSYISFLVNEAVKSIEEQGDTSTITSDIQNSYQDSFRYNQCLDGIEKAVDIDVNRLNNAIQVQFQFNENDRFAIQAREPPGQQFDDDAIKRTTGRDCTAQYSEIHFDYANAFENYLQNKTDIYGTLPKPDTNITTESIVDNVGNEINCQNIHESANAYFRDFMKEQSRKSKRCTISNVIDNRHAQNTEDNLVKSNGNIDDIIDLTDELPESDTHSGVKKHRKSMKGLNYLKETQSSFKRKNVDKSLEDIALMDIYQCGVCGKKFSRIDALSEHIDAHRDSIVKDACERTHVSDFECKSRKSDDKNDHVRQVNTHNAATDAFVSNVTDHDKDNNDENTCMLCVTCGKTFNSQAELDKHVDDSHPVGAHRAAVNSIEREYHQLFRKLSEKQNEHVQDVSEHDRPISNQFTDQNRQEVDTVPRSIATQVQSVGVSRTSRSRLAFKRNSRTQGNTKETSSERSLPGNYDTFCQISRLGHQAKNSLTNPSKGKQKRVASHISKGDDILMTRYDVSPSKVQLKKVNDKSRRLEPSSDKCQSKKVIESSKPEPYLDISQAMKMNESRKQGHSPKKSKSKFGQDELTVGTPDIFRVKTDTSKNLVCAKEIVQNIGSSFTNDPIDNDLDVVIIEKPIELIVLDDSPEDIATSPKKLEKCQPEGNKTLDAMLLKQFGIKDVTVTLSKNITNFSPMGQAEIERYVACTRARRKVEFETSTHKIDDLNSAKTGNLPKQCGMNISFPVNQVNKVGLNVPIKKDVIRSHSPQPSTSKGNVHLKMKKTARKSTKDTALMEKYSLKESSVLLKNLSRSELSMLRNPHSWFGKCEWLKHKFNSDSESDKEWDIPNPPLTEEFKEAPSSGKNNDKTKKLEAHRSNSKKSGEGKSKDNVLLHMDAIPGSGFETPKKLNAISFKIKSEAQFTKSRKEKHEACLNESDKELIEKFGLPSVIVIIDSPLKESTNKHSNLPPGNGGSKHIQERDADQICSKTTHIINDYSNQPQKKSKYNLKTSANNKHYKNSESVTSKRFETNRLSENEKKLEVQAREFLHDASFRNNSHENMWKTKQTKHSSILGQLRAKSVLRAIESGQKRSRMVVAQTNEKVQPDKIKSKSVKRSAKDTDRCTIPLKKPRRNIEQMAKKCAESKHRGPAKLKHRPPASFIARKQNIKPASCNNKKIKSSKYLANIDTLNRYKHLLQEFPQVKVSIPCLTQKDIGKCVLDPDKAVKVDVNAEACNSLHADSNTMVQSIIEELLAEVCNSPDNVSNLQLHQYFDVLDEEIYKIDNHTETAETKDDPEKSIITETFGKESITEISLSVAVENGKNEQMQG